MGWWWGGWVGWVGARGWPGEKCQATWGAVQAAARQGGTHQLCCCSCPVAGPAPFPRRPPTSAAPASPCLPPQARVVSDLVLLSCVGIQPVMVHGGGPEINTWLGKLGIEAQFKNGLRVTDGAPQGPGHPLAPPRSRAWLAAALLAAGLPP